MQQTGITKHEEIWNHELWTDLQFVVLEGVVHHDTVSYIPALRETIPWLKEQWQKKDR